MAQYKTHTRFNFILALPMLIWAQIFIFGPSQHSLLVFSGVFIYGTLFLNPDLDLAHQIKLFSIRGFLTLPFRLYSRIFSHRGIYHMIFLGTLTRIVWFFLFFTLIFFLVHKSLFTQSDFFYFVKKHQNDLIFGLAGLVTADLCHIMIDIFSPKRSA